MEMVTDNFRTRSEDTCSANLHEEDDMNRYSPTSPTDNSPIQSPIPRKSGSPNRYSPTNPTDDVDYLEDHIFRTDRPSTEESSAPADTEYDAAIIAKEGSSTALGAEENSSQNDNDSDCDSENRLVIQVELEEEREGGENVTEIETENRKGSESAEKTEAGCSETSKLSEVTKSFSHNIDPQDHSQEEGGEQKEKAEEYGEDSLAILNVESIPLPDSEPEDNHRGDTSDVLQLSADNDLETRHNDVDARKGCSDDDSSSDESDDSQDKRRERSSSSSSSSSSSDQSPEYDGSPDSSSSEHQSGIATGEDKSLNESDKESSGELLDEDNSVDNENFRNSKEKTDKGSKSGASPNSGNSHSRCIEDGIDIIEMSDDLDERDYSCEPRLTGFDGAPKGSPALGVTRVIQRINVDNEGRGGDSRTVQAGIEDSDDDVQIIECPPQEPIDTLIVDDDDDDDVVPCGSGDPRKTVSEQSRSHRSKKKRTVEQDGHDLRIVIREERRDRDDLDRSRRRRDKRSHGQREEKRSNSHRRNESVHHSSEHMSGRRRHRSHSRSRERRRSRRSRSRSRSRDRSSRRRRHRDRSRERERSSEREKERDREKSRRRKRHDRNHEHHHKSPSRSHSPRPYRGNSWDKENHEEQSNREVTSHRRYRNRHYRHHEESGPEESPVVESKERKRKKRKRDREESPSHENRHRKREDYITDRNHRKHEESPVVERRHRRHVEEREESPVVERRRRRHTEGEELTLVDRSSRSRRHVEQHEESPHVEKRNRRRLKEQEESPYVERRSGRHIEEQYESPVVKRKSRRHVEEYEETLSEEKKSRSRRHREEQEETFMVERRGRRHIEEQIESPVVDRRSRRHAEEREEMELIERKRRKHVEILADSSLIERRNKSRKHADDWDELPINDRSNRRHMEELPESPIIERRRTQSSTWSPSDTFQKDPSDSSDSDSSSTQESDEGSEEEDSEEEEEEVERQVVLVNRDEEDEQLESEREDEDIQNDDSQMSKPDSVLVPESDDVYVHEPDDVSVHEVENMPSPEPEPAMKDSRKPSVSEEEAEETFPTPEQLPPESAEKLEDLSSKPESGECSSPAPANPKVTPEEAVYDPAHPTESETEKGQYPGISKPSPLCNDKMDGAHSPKHSPSGETSVGLPSGDGSSLGTDSKKESSVSGVISAHHHLMVNSVLVRPPFGSGFPRSLTTPPIPPGFQLQIGGPGNVISIKSQPSLLPPGPPPLPRGIPDQLNSRPEGGPHSVGQFSPASLSTASAITNSTGLSQPSGLHTMFPSSKEGKVTVDKFDNTLANLMVAQNLLSAMKEGGQSNVLPPPKSVFKPPQPPVPPPPKLPVRLPPGLAASATQSQSEDSRELMDMDMSPLDDECELELPTPPDDLEDKQKIPKPPLAAVNLKALTNAIRKLTSQPTDDMPASAVELTNKEKYLKKLHLQERVVDEVKQALRPFYSHKKITKEEYKGILRKAVPKICHSKSGDINPQKILQLVEGYVNKFQKQRHRSSKKDKPAKTSKERVKANGERGKSTR